MPAVLLREWLWCEFVLERERGCEGSWYCWALLAKACCCMLGVPPCEYAEDVGGREPPAPGWSSSGGALEGTDGTRLWEFIVIESGVSPTPAAQCKPVGVRGVVLEVAGRGLELASQ